MKFAVKSMLNHNAIIKNNNFYKVKFKIKKHLKINFKFPLN